MRQLIKAILRPNEVKTLSILKKKLIPLNNYEELKKLFGWKNDPIISQPNIFEFEYEEDLNERRIRDAEALGTVLQNLDAKIVLEIGTSDGKGTAHLSENSPNSRIYTINIPPDGFKEGDAGHHITHLLEVNQIGSYYREKGFKNIEQILANTKYWKPEIGTIDFAFIDGCHDKEFVINDTQKVISHMKPGSFILWHDFNPNLVNNYKWINEVMEGIDELFRMKILSNKVYHIKDSWIGIYKV